MTEQPPSGPRFRNPAIPAASPDEIWLAASWPFIRDQLGTPPKAVIELGCGEAGGHVPTLLRAGYQPIGIDPVAPPGSEYRPMEFEDYRPDGLVDAVIASVSLHHVTDVDMSVARVADVLRPGGRLIVIEWISEDFDEATAEWCFRHRPRDAADAGGWLAELRAEWVASGLPWRAFIQGWLEHHGLHPAAAIRHALEAHFITTHESAGPYYFPDLTDADADAERAAIDAGQIKAGCLRYAGRRPE